MKILGFLLILVTMSGCIKKLTQVDVDLATCVCAKYDKSELVFVRRESIVGLDGYLQFQCSNKINYIHADDAYTVGCSKLEK